jgi:KipI family sensor histidine kinase inhibitor
MNHELRMVPCGDRALLIYLGDTIDPQVNDSVHALARALKQPKHPAVIEITPSYHAVMVEYDPVRLRLEQLEELVLATAQTIAHEPPAAGRTVEIPVAYGGDMGPDLDSVAAYTGLTPEAVIQRHTDPLYRVYCLGFSPGFPYLGGLDPALHTPRLPAPRTKLPSGSVGIGGTQTGIYPAPSPGGWQLIGRTPALLFDPHRDTPALLEAGDSVRFVPITAEQFVADTPGRPAPLPSPEGRTGLKIIQPGFATTLQDLGRRGYTGYGVSVAGAADFIALMVGNWLLSNRARTSGLETTVNGPEVEFTGASAFCLTGATSPAEFIPADGSAPYFVPFWTALLAWPGDRLRIGTATEGCRSYLCVAGGFDLPLVLGSLSEDLFGKIGPLGRPLQAGDWLPIGLPLQPPAALAGRSVPKESLPAYHRPAMIRVVRGPQADRFTAEAFATLFASEYTVGAQSDRQALLLEGPVLMHQGNPEILSEPVSAGSIQVPANGQPIMLMNNRQTSGGYAKIGVALYSDLAMAAQLRPGESIRFQEVDLATAHAITRAERKRLAQIRRHLERQLGAQPDTGAPPPIPAPAPVGAPALATIASLTQPPAHPFVRTFRIAIGGIEFQAEVEEVVE